MGRLLVEGGVPLHGTVSVSGSKNAALPILAATVLLNGEAELTNIPNVTDIVTMVRVLRALGLRVEYLPGKFIRTWGGRPIKSVAPFELVTKMRASFFVAGPILTRTGLARVPLPGGCSIGTRPVDIHLKGFAAMGADIHMEHGIVFMQAKELRGTRIYFDFPSVGATENIMMAATLAKGVTIIENAACEPEVSDLAYFLVACGARISGIGTPVITIEGVNELRGSAYRIIPDRIEAGTLLLAAAITHGEVTIQDMNIPHNAALLEKLQDAGVKSTVHDATSISIHPNGVVKAINLETQPFPGFATDLQAPMMAFLSLCQGTSVIRENIFENRFQHSQELGRMGAQIQVDLSTAIISGVPRLSGAPVKATDLRAGAALLIASLAAEGLTELRGTRHLYRGYENIYEKLTRLGARLKPLE